MKNIIIPICLVMLLFSCSENDKYFYETEKTYLNIWIGSTASMRDSIAYNYSYRAMGVETDSIMFMVRLAGTPKDKDLTFNLIPFEGDINNIQEGKHYEFGNYTLKAGTINAEFPIYLKNTSDFADKIYTVSFKLKETEDLKIGAEEYSVIKLTLKDLEEMPENWEQDGWPYFPLNTFFGTYSVKKHQFMISVIGKAVFRVLYQGTPTPPDEISYFEAQYLQKKCRAELEKYNNDPLNPDTPLTDEHGPITF